MNDLPYQIFGPIMHHLWETLSHLIKLIIIKYLID